MKVEILQEEFELLPQKALWWSAQKTLLLADMHFGKINHFRKAGIPVPVKANTQNWETLIEVVKQKMPERMICIGDLFHSHYNSDWESVGAFTRNFPQVSFELVTGNHDMLSDHQYLRNRIIVHKENLQIGSFTFSHFPVGEIPHGKYVLSGHLHPGVRLVGKGKQSMTLPCFYLGTHQGYLPAFGMFTGIARIKPKATDRIFAIADCSIFKV
jgi:uncharacterized protein